MIDDEGVKQRYELMKLHLNERARRLFLASEAIALGYGGIMKVHKATGVARSTITDGCKDIKSKDSMDPERIRRSGAGRKKTTDKDPTVISDLENLIEPTTRGDPKSPLRWTCKSTPKLSEELKKRDHNVSHTWVGRQLHKLKYSLQGNKKTKEGTSHPDRNAQFEHINEKTKEFLREIQPVISVDTKKKENVGDFKNNGREWHQKGNPERVRVHDFKIKELGKVNPYGVYDFANNRGWVNVGIDNDTAQFAVESIRWWWHEMGNSTYKKVTKILVTADCGGSNGYRNGLWKAELQKLADEIGVDITVCHFPPGTSKWNKIEHRLFSFITQNWRGKPLISHATILSLISATTTSKGLKVKCRLDTNQYPKGIKVTKEQLAQLNIQGDIFHAEWNYTIRPRNMK